MDHLTFKIGIHIIFHNKILQLYKELESLLKITAINLTISFSGPFLNDKIKGAHDTFEIPYAPPMLMKLT
ncbi:MAG: hypothetical protein CM1200mP35_08670 [Chloroflexota bacterium]|nr:MAG: hypothetical protein CM1200mP35_08670 [Chloroflexota bacterium]